MKHILAASLAIAVSGSVLGIVCNSLASTPVPILRSYTGMLSPLSVYQAQQWFREDSALFIDARPSREWAQGYIPGSLNWPAGGSYILPATSKRLVLCGDEEGSAQILGENLKSQGRQMYVLKGGLSSWRQAGFPVSAL